MIKTIYFFVLDASCNGKIISFLKSFAGSISWWGKPSWNSEPKSGSHLDLKKTVVAPLARKSESVL